MGYYTTHELTILEGDDFDIHYHEEEISKAAGYGGCFSDEIKWYSRREDMVEYSKKHPNTLFQIYGIGEESGDIWKEYYKNGKQHRIKGEIAFDEFDKESLG